ncbi:NAD(P)-dependent oxidoreductase [Mesorhizobium sp. VK25A]|uniref:NAD(P)-dependent oxidoreductase n=1 Tax=Mesorhizobium vachelliae TaxID=3072309 RepID=A0ABU5ACN3_9HYPH|nr:MULTISPECIES: NAD(P)-dependent oxidoreductase [unclassified Mesorhizobium]MDX8535150.1 NAD(P)-dependent oxidoreductase [Mesorhizobium sp. VK25D]MDX8547926.1 NAD(P)-dependent oxidoreductase [Mesorhizobium sp. VK25A]
MKPILVLDQYWRKLEELFSASDYRRLESACNIIGGTNWSMPQETLDANLETMRFLVASRPMMDRQRLAQATNLQAIIEVSGNFPPSVDYQACFERGVSVLSCAPGFRNSVAEMALGMMIAGGRGMVEEHLAFQAGYEHWLDDNPTTDFSLYDQTVGFVGYGSIARELTRLLQPFSPRIAAFDPWLKAENVTIPGVELMSLDELIEHSRCVVIAATPTDQNRGLVDETAIRRMKRGTLVVLISRAHLVDFDALMKAARDRHIRVAIDVFPSEPVSLDDPVRSLPNSILSPHRAAAVEGGRHLIGRMIADDISEMIAGREPRQLQKARPGYVEHIVAVRKGH